MLATSLYLFRASPKYGNNVSIEQSAVPDIGIEYTLQSRELSYSYSLHVNETGFLHVNFTIMYSYLLFIPIFTP